MTACFFAGWAHVCWNWAARAARTAVRLFILGRTLNMSRSLDTRRLGSIRRACRLWNSWLKSTTAWPNSTSVSPSKERNYCPFRGFKLVAGIGSIMKTKLSNTLFTAVLTGAMALGAGTSLVAQDQSMDKPSASVSGQATQGPPAEQTAPQYNAPQVNAPNQS